MSTTATNKHKAIALVSWLIVAWTCYVFLSSLPYKFSLHPDTQHIFGTIGDWLGGLLGTNIGSLFANYGAFAVGGVELLTSIVLLMPALLWVKSLLGNSASQAQENPDSPEPLLTETDDSKRRLWHRLGGLIASAVMAGAVFFHLFTPLGIAVLHNGESDNGSLFYSAVSILVLGGVLFTINRPFSYRSTAIRSNFH